MEIEEVARVLVDKALKVHQGLGPGLLESVYQRILAYELRKAGLSVETEVGIPVRWDGHLIDEGFRADMILNSSILVELKSVEKTLPVHRKQTLTYLKLADLQLGFLVNFGSALLKDDLHRLVNGYRD